MTELLATVRDGDRGGGGRARSADRVAVARSRGFERRHVHRRLGRLRGSHRRGVDALSRGCRPDRPRAAGPRRQRGRVVVRPRRRAPGAAGRSACATASTSRPIVTPPSSARSAARDVRSLTVRDVLTPADYGRVMSYLERQSVLESVDVESLRQRHVESARRGARRRARARAACSRSAACCARPPVWARSAR